MDLPLVQDAEAARQGRHKIVVRPGARPPGSPCSPAGAPQVRWFTAEPCYIYHVVNAWEDGRRRS